MAPKKVDKRITLKGAKLITLWRPKGGQTNYSPAYIYIYAVKLKTGPRFGGFRVKNWSKFKVITGPSFSFHCFLGMFKNTDSVILCQNSVFAKLWGCQK